MNLNQRVYMACVEMVVQRINQLEAQLEDLRTQLGSEEKSTAGDKHETGRAMLHLEQEQLSKQLLEANSQLALIRSIPLKQDNGFIKLGNLVETSYGYYYLCCSLGKLRVDELDVMTTSVLSPLGRALLGKRTGDDLSLSNKLIRIISIK